MSLRIEPSFMTREKTTVEKLRLLCLHGYRGTAEVLRGQLAPLAEGLDELAEFVCLDAPSLAAGDFGWWRAAPIQSTAVQMDAGVSPTTAGKEHGRRSFPPLFVRGLLTAFLASAKARR
jgi:hypothetical protein